MSDILREKGCDRKPKKKKTYLINVGKIHLYQPCCVGVERRLPPGSSMQSESQTSPSTFAYDVKMSAKITSEKCTRWFMGDDMHRLTLLVFPRGVCQREKRYRKKKESSGRERKEDIQDERVSFAFLHDVVRGKHKYEDNKCAHGRYVLEDVDEHRAAVRGGAIECPRTGAPQDVPDREAINGRPGGDGGRVCGCLERAVRMSTVDGKRGRSGGSALVCA